MTKITIDKAVLDQALEWFEWFHNGSTIASPASSTQVMRTLREAQPQPVPNFKEWTADYVRENLHKLKAQPQPVQHPEPFQVLCDHCDGSGNDPKNNNYGCAVCGGGGSVFRMLYTSPQAQPLSDEQIADAYEAMAIQNHLTWAAYLAGARHAEAAHGIKGTK